MKPFFVMLCFRQRLMQPEATMENQPEATMENLPEEMKEDILLRLPVKSLACLKCVSKSWRSIISNPNFAKLHLQLSPYSQSPNRILLPISPQMRSIDINDSLHNDSNAIDLIFPGTEVCIMGSCRGILLLQTQQKYDHALILWNPVVAAFKHLTLLRHQTISLPVPFAFCYDESLDDYFIGLSYDHKSCIWRDNFVVLSLRTRFYQKLDLKHHYRMHSNSSNRGGTIFNGAIHFSAAIYYDEGSYSTEHVYAFDITTKDLREVPLPISTGTKSPCLGIHKGYLALTCENLTDEIQVWVMRDYGVKSSWAKLFSVSCDQSGMGRIQPFVLFKDDGDEFVTYHLTEDGEVGLSKWNDKGELLEHRAYDSKLRKIFSYTEYWKHALAHTETLLPLP